MRRWEVRRWEVRGEEVRRWEVGGEEVAFDEQRAQLLLPCLATQLAAAGCAS